MRKLCIFFIVSVIVFSGCGSGGSGGGGGGAGGGPFVLDDSWPVQGSASKDFSGGLSLAATSQFVFCAAIGVGVSEIHHYKTDGEWVGQIDTNSSYDQPTALSFTGGFLYAADKNNNRFVKQPVIPLSGETSIRSRPSSPNLAFGLASTADRHFMLWFSGTGADLIEKTYLNGTSTGVSRSVDDGQALAVDSAGDLYMLKMNAGEVVKYSGADLSELASFGSGDLTWPLDIAINSSDEIFVINSGDEIVMYNNSGVRSGSFGSFNGALGIAASGDYVYVADWNNGDEVIYRYRRK